MGGSIVIGIYLRTSTKKQETAAQRNLLEKWIKHQHYKKAEIRWYIDEHVSGKVTDRPQFQNMLRDASEKKLSKIITFEVSRLSRDFLHLLDVFRTLKSHNVEVEIPFEGTIPFDSVMEQFMVAAKSLASAQEREHISRRTKEAIEAKIKAGKRWGRPKGSKDSKPRITKTPMEKNPELVQNIIKLRRKNNSTTTIADVLNVSQNKVWRILQKYKDELVV